MFNTWSKVSDFLYQWQSLAGAFLGAFLPILVSLFIYSYKSRKEFKRGMGQVEQFLVFSINNLYELKEELTLFLNRINSLIQEIETTQSDQFFLGTTNFPLASMEHRLQDINKPTKSLYLTNKLMKCYSMLKETYSFLEDAGDEFKSITLRNYDVVLSYKDPSQKIGVYPENQRGLYLCGLKEFRKVIKETILDKNIPTTIKSLLGARLVLLKYIGRSSVYW